MRSAPTTTRLTSPAAMRDAAAPSTMTLYGMPARSSSQAVSRPPWSSGRVSSTQHVLDLASRVGAADGAERRAVAAGRERAGVAVGERSRPARAEESRRRASPSRRSGRPPRGGLRAPARPSTCRIGASACSSAIAQRKVDRGRSRGEQSCRRGVEVLAASGCERIPHGGCDADRGSAADREGRGSPPPPRRPSDTRAQAVSSGSRRWSSRTTRSSSSRTISSGRRSACSGSTSKPAFPRLVRCPHPTRRGTAAAPR